MVSRCAEGLPFGVGVGVAYAQADPPGAGRKKAKSRATNKVKGRTTMSHRCSIGVIALFAALFITVADSQAWDDKLYPDFSGQWRPIGGPGRFDISKPPGKGQQAPLTAEYQAVFEADAHEGGQSEFNQTYRCWSPGMPRVSNGYGEIEFVVSPKTTHILVDHIYDNRRIFTDGRPWPNPIIPTLLGYSIGKWVDTDGDGRYDVLEVETRGFRGPRAFDASGLPLHRDNQTVIKEKLFIDKSDSNVSHNEVTVIDNALTRPWTVMKNFRRNAEPFPSWIEENCPETNNHVTVGKEDYMISWDGHLMPTKKGQQAPDLRYFK